METYKRGTKVELRLTDYCWIISNPAGLRLDVDHRDQSDARCQTSAPDVTRDQILNGRQCSDDCFSHSDFVVFRKLRKKLPQRLEGLNLSAPYSPPPLLFSIDFLHNRHFN